MADETQPTTQSATAVGTDAVSSPTAIPAPAAPSAPGPDVVVQSAAPAPVSPAPTSLISDPTGAATAQPSPTQDAVAAVVEAATEPAPPNRCMAFRASVRAWEVARFSAVLAVVGSWSFAKCINNLVTGFRTIIVFGVLGGIGLSDSLGSLDLTGLIQEYIPNVKAGDIITVMSLLGIALRAISKTPLFQQWRTGRKPGSVDEPN